MTQTWLPGLFSSSSRSLRTVGGIAVCAGLVALAGCSSPPSRFYTLGSDATTAPARSATHAQFLIEVPPVDVPAQVAKTSFVVQSGANQVDVLEQTRWASLPGDEIRRALSVDLTQRLGTIDVAGTAYPDGVPVYRVSVNVQRFESWPGSHALIDAVWSVRAVRTQAVMTCRSVISEPVTGGYDALVDGHRRAVQDMSAQIATAVGALAAAPQPRVASASTSASAKKGATAPANVQPVTVPCPLPASTGASADTARGVSG
ncbi:MULTISPECIES: membrane integrity-associated transporter subunit PqiC [Paraburkholderia]|uniref:PqiC family protein n=1 Tax=Paraburkholderia TaxID=1822464 RepID=UPI00225039D8|nr:MULTISPECIES: PqiC family protein [Paraburkholderia]MCX4160379.1 PqiC family protein [Paraburkholderia megapolitana]MDN7155877.1 PqiC family protein [Paraburkholderia sp. CHISQ3]MDQ6492921.1 PqiC family protein [Paraburkholderia megapolitana]